MKLKQICLGQEQYDIMNDSAIFRMGSGINDVEPTSRKVTNFWDIAPCSLAEIDISEVLLASMIRVMIDLLLLDYMAQYLRIIFPKVCD